MNINRFLFILFLFCWISPSFAVRPPQAKLFDNKSTPGCLQVRPSWLANPPEAAGDISGPSVSVTNKCAGNIVIDAVAVSPSDETVVGAVLATMANGYIEYIGLRRFPEGAACFADAPPKAETDLRCKSVTVPPGDTLIIPVPWGSHYDYSGQAGEEKLKVTGWMLNPADPQQLMDLLNKGMQGK